VARRRTYVELKRGPDGVYRQSGAPRPYPVKPRDREFMHSQMGAPLIPDRDTLKEIADEFGDVARAIADVALLPVELVTRALSKLGALPTAAVLAYGLVELTKREHRRQRSGRKNGHGK